MLGLGSSSPNPLLSRLSIDRSERALLKDVFLPLLDQLPPQVVLKLWDLLLTVEGLGS